MHKKKRKVVCDKARKVKLNGQELEEEFVYFESVVDSTNVRFCHVQLWL